MNSIEEIIKRTISNDVLLYLNGDTLKYRGPKVIDKQLHEDIKKNKEEIISFLKNAGKSVERKLPDIRKRNPDKPLLLSYAQQRLWFIDQLEGNSAHYNLPIAFRLNGILKIKAFKQALRDLLERHEVLRTRFNILEGEPVQVVQEAFELPLTQLDLSGLEA